MIQKVSTPQKNPEYARRAMKGGYSQFEIFA